MMSSMIVVAFLQGKALLSEKTLNHVNHRANAVAIPDGIQESIVIHVK